MRTACGIHERLLFPQLARELRHRLVDLRLAAADDCVFALFEIALVPSDEVEGGYQGIVVIEQRIAQLQHDLVEL
ncbi:MAG: hypothetical protein HYU76_07165 [Betaproteobacteria bacterium]|nr:hypothetical protein [Betaproteobacteria bacterium]